jgi:hypothetical protein
LTAQAYHANAESLLPAVSCLLVADAIAKARATSRGKKGSAKAIAEAVSSASSLVKGMRFCCCAALTML